MYFTITNEGNFLYIGSANASHNAFHKNVEFLLKLKYKPNCVGFKTFFNDFIPDENCPYEKIETAPEMLPAAAVQASIDKTFKEAVYALNGAKVFANGDVYDIQVEAKGLKTEETVKIAPFQRQDLLQPLQTQTLLKGMLLRELSEFYIISVQDQKIVIKIDTKGIPVERDSSIYKSIINTRTKFLSYLSFMLSENYTAAALEDSEYMHLMQGGEEELSNAPVYAAVYEKMLKVIHQNPARLKEVADVIRRLDQDIVGDEFLEMYKHFELAARRLRK